MCTYARYLVTVSNRYMCWKYVPYMMWYVQELSGTVDWYKKEQEMFCRLLVRGLCTACKRVMCNVFEKIYSVYNNNNSEAYSCNSCLRYKDQNSGRDRNRTGDLMHAKHTRCQLRHTPMVTSSAFNRIDPLAKCSLALSIAFDAKARNSSLSFWSAASIDAICKILIPLENLHRITNQYSLTMYALHHFSNRWFLPHFWLLGFDFDDCTSWEWHQLHVLTMFPSNVTQIDLKAFQFFNIMHVH